jgi:hypothetical protein
MSVFLNSIRKGHFTMKRYTVIMLIGTLSTLFAMGAAFSQPAGPQAKDQNHDQPFTTNCQRPWDRPPYLGNDWNIERGMIRQWGRPDMSYDALSVYPLDHPPYRPFTTPIDKNNAQIMAKIYLNSTNNPNLKLGKEKDEVTDYEFDILTRDNSLVDRLLVNKNTGEIRSAY